MGKSVPCKKASGGNGKGLRKHHGPNSGKNRDHTQKVPQSEIVAEKPYVSTMRATVRNGEGKVQKVVKASNVIIPGISVSTETQKQLLELKGRLQATA